MTMLKNAVTRGLLSFVSAVTINVIVYMILIIFAGKNGQPPMLPEYMALFDDEIFAMLTLCVLVGLSAAAFGAGSIVMEIEKLGMIVQSIIYFVITTAVWLPVACLCWGVHRYLPAMLSVSISYMISYAISWGIQYRACKRNVEMINRRLEELGQNGECD